MKTLLAILLLSFSLAATANITMTSEMNEETVQRWTEITCKFLEDEYECPDGIPAVVFGELPERTLGLYFGKNLIMLNSVLDNMNWGILGEAILSHEIVHWIVRHDSPDMTHCDSEAIAWRVYNAVVLSAGKPDLARHDWIKNYPECQAE